MEVGADKTGGGFHEAIDLAGKPVLGERRARVQARQIFTYAVAGELGWNGPWREAVRHGLDYYIGRYRRPDGLFVNALRADGSPSPRTRISTSRPSRCWRSRPPAIRRWHRSPTRCANGC